MDRVYKNIRLVCDGFFCKEKRKELLSIEEQCVVVRYSEKCNACSECNQKWISNYRDTVEKKHKIYLKFSSP